MKGSALLVTLVALAGTQLLGSVSVQLSVPGSTIQVGQTLVVTATATDSVTSNTRFSYQFTVRPPDQGSFVTAQDFYFDDAFPWTPSDHEGSYDIGVTAWSEATGATASSYITIDVQSRIIGNKPVISSTRNALVALYSAPPCNAPAQMRVSFKAQSTPTTYTPFKSCNGLSMNFYLAGMLEDTTYSVQQFVSSGAGTITGPQLSYTTGTIPSDIPVPAHATLFGPTAAASKEPYLLQLTIGRAPYAADLQGNVVWYKPLGAGYGTGDAFRLLKGGDLLSVEDDPADSKIRCQGVSLLSCGDHQYLRESDPAGNLVRQTSWAIVNDRVNAMRAKRGRSPVRLSYISHEAIRLPNGYTAMIVTDEQVKQLTSGVQDVFGDAIVVLDTHFQVVWAWDAFDYLDVNRGTIRTICSVGGSGCPQVFLQKQPNGQPYTKALDWTHSNSISYDPADGNLIVSVRHQSWAIKIAYNNAAGDGHIVWKLGYGGSFTLPAGYPVSDWFSGQHNVEVQSNGRLTLFDNNNPSAFAHQPGGTAHGQVWSLDTAAMVATPVVNIDLGVYSLAVGSSAQLSNGNYEWQAGFIDNDHSQTFEYTPAGTLVYKQQSDSLTYRSFRLQDLYTP